MPLIDHATEAPSRGPWPLSLSTATRAGAGVMQTMCRWCGDLPACAAYETAGAEPSVSLVANRGPPVLSWVPDWRARAKRCPAPPAWPGSGDVGSHCGLASPLVPQLPVAGQSPGSLAVLRIG